MFRLVTPPTPCFALLCPATLSLVIPARPVPRNKYLPRRALLTLLQQFWPPSLAARAIALPLPAPCTATSRQNRLNGRISIHAVGNLTTADGFPTNGWKSIHWMEIQPGLGLNSNHLSLNTWMEIQPSLKQNQAYNLTNFLWPPKGPLGI